MYARQRNDIIGSLINAVKADIMSKVHLMPDDWDGEELRRYIADRFEQECNLLRQGRVRANKAGKRLAAYHATVILRGL